MDEKIVDLEYKLVGEKVSKFIAENKVDYDSAYAEIQDVMKEFNDKFSPEKLKQLTGENVLGTIFNTRDHFKESLCYFLEFYPPCKNNFGSILGGSSYKFGLFQKVDSGQWMTGSAQKPQILTEEEAIHTALKIRDDLVQGAAMIGKCKLESVEDYEILDDELDKLIGDNYHLAWYHKYFSMVFPDKLTTWHSSVWQKHILYTFKIKPSEKYYGRCGQLTIIRKYAKVNNQLFGAAAYKMVGDIKHFWRIGTTDSKGESKCAEELIADQAVGIGWNKIGDLNGLKTGKVLDKDLVKDSLIKEYYTKDSQMKVAGKKAGEICNFYNTDAGTVLVAMEGEKLLGLVDGLGEYFYDPSKMLGHRKSGTWHLCFDKDQKLPNPNEGHLSTCSEITKPENLMFLYEKYYSDSSKTVDQIAPKDEKVIFEYKTSLETPYEWNRIVFGAPGTGKSYRLKEDADNLLNNYGGSMERVTFHPEYTYSQFVGTYKPTTNELNEIRYEFVPGPFMRVYVEALRSAHSLNPQPCLLLIEEINRAKAASVFGDVFQLLDRDEDGVSEYDIVASEDIRKYLVKELGGQSSDYNKIQIPNNMFIWASMNSADQGVYPMDTAFKRRWNFEYIGIDENDSDIQGHLILGKDGNELDVDVNVLRKAINQKLSQDFKVNEDKLIGPFFISRSLLKVKDDTDTALENPEKFIKAFKSKVIMYLYEDAARQFKQRLFSGCDSSRYSAVCDAFDQIGIKIFGEDFVDSFYENQKGQ